MKRYGMRYSTIRYFQSEAKWLHVHYGTYYADKPLRDVIDELPARTIAHDVIGLAFVASPDYLKKILLDK